MTAGDSTGRRRGPWAATLLALAGACGGGDFVGAEVEQPPMEECLVLDVDSPFGFRSCIGLPLRQGVDILFVIEDGPQSAAWQARLADAMPGLVDGLLALDPQPDVRIGFVSASGGNPVCGAATVDPGQLVASSCHERAEAFVEPAGPGSLTELCASRCELPALGIQPSVTADDPQARVRPWIEVGAQGSNVAADVDVGEALQCAAVLGTSGCELAAPLASARSAYLRSQDPTVTARGFFRNGLPSITVMVGGGVDCSLSADGAEAFDPSGDRALWPDPEATEPTPALCWNAGVQCTEDLETGELDCQPADIGLDGMAADGGPSVLEPVREFDGFFAGLDDLVRAFDPGAGATQVIVAGFEPGFAPGDPIHYELPEDPTADPYGVVPTCTVDGSVLLPPVRLAALGATDESPLFGRTFHSACEPSYAPAIQSVVDATEEYLRPNCFPGCALDEDLETPGLQVDCRIIVSEPAGEIRIEHVLMRCDPALEGEASIPPDQPGCWLPRTDSDLHPRCADEGWNLEIDLRWRGRFPNGGYISPSCGLSDDKARDCPNLP